MTASSAVMYKWLPVRRPADFHGLAELIPEPYAPAEVAALLEHHATSQCCAVLVEFAYVDKDYRSTYYNFYAKKGLRYESFCVRLHFFAADVTFDSTDLELRATKGDLQNQYMGFMVLRPTRVATIGRTVISTRLTKGFDGRIIGTSHKVHILGKRLKAWGFPWMNQHRDVAVCAHVACWSILRHYSERYGLYAERLTHDVTRLAYDFDPGGLVPSLGLTVLHAEHAFAVAGAYPVLVLPQEDDDEAFCRQLLAYVESGFPVFAALPNEHRHAIAIIGSGSYRDSPGAEEEPKPLYFSADFVDTLIANDDNYMPYRSVARVRGDVDYTLGDIGAFIVPLPDKVHYPASAVDEFALQLSDSGSFGIGIDPTETPVIRYFLTSAASLTRFVVNNASQFTQPVRATILQLPMTQFVWIIEVSTLDQWRQHHITFRAVLDATASVTDTNPLFMIHNDRKIVIINRAGSAQPLEKDFSPLAGIPLTRMPGNLGNSDSHEP